MDTERILAGLETLISFLHGAILFLTFLAFTFVFVINQEDWLFGVKLAGPPAGLLLAARAAGALAILFLIIRYPDRWRAVLPVSIAYFGFQFASGIATYRVTAPGSFPVALGLLVLFPFFLLFLKWRRSRSGPARVK